MVFSFASLGTETHILLFVRNTRSWFICQHSNVAKHNDLNPAGHFSKCQNIYDFTDEKKNYLNLLNTYRVMDATMAANCVFTRTGQKLMIAPFLKPGSADCVSSSYGKGR
jgi:hypothetical protein